MWAKAFRCHYEYKNSRAHLDLQDKVIMLMVRDTGSSCDGTGHTLVRKPCTMLTHPWTSQIQLLLSVKWQECVGTGGSMVTRYWLLLCSGETRHPGAGPRGKVALEPSDMVAR